MGCTQSKIENEEAVARCKDRKVHMKEAVGARNAFAAAHSAYTVSLKNTGAALSDYGQADSIPHAYHQHHLPAAASTSSSAAADSISAAASSSSAAVGAAAASSSNVVVQPPVETLPPPPPPLPDFSPSPLQRSSSMPDLPVRKQKKPPADSTIREEEDDLDTDNTDHLDAVSTPPRETNPIATPTPPLPPKSQPAPAPPPPPAPEPSRWDYFFDMDPNMPPPSLEPQHHDQEFPPEIEAENFKTPTQETPPVVIEEPPVTPEKTVVEPPPPPPVVMKPAKKIKQGGSASVHHQHAASVGAVVEGKRSKMVTVSAQSASLVQVLNELDDHFLKAYESAHEVSKMLEATRMHYHSNFADNRGHIDHSARVMKVITWNRSFKGTNADDGKDDFENDEWETHATILDKMLAWEKKLYDEVKAGELMKIEYQRKVALLNKQKKRKSNPETLEKTKAAVSHLHTRYIVDMQSMDSTVSEINRLRDDQLYPKLVDLVSGMAKMWETMQEHHDSQFKIVSNKTFNISNAPEETSEPHHERTVQLWHVVREWDSQFDKLVKHQKEYIHSLNSWLKLNLIPIESSLKEKVSSPPRAQHPPIQALLLAWHDELEKLPAELASRAIFGFAAAIDGIVVHQQEELKQREKCEEVRKDFVRKSRAFEDWYHKYTQKRGPAGMEEATSEGGEGTNHNDPVAERKFVVDSLRSKLDDEIEAHKRLCKQVREKSLTSLRTNLPELFRAMSDFASASSKMYSRLRSISQPAEPTG